MDSGGLGEGEVAAAVGRANWEWRGLLYGQGIVAAKVVTAAGMDKGRI